MCLSGSRSAPKCTEVQVRVPSLSLGLPGRLPSRARTTAPVTAAGLLCPLRCRQKGRSEGSLCITVLFLLPVCFPEATAAPTSAARLPTPAPVPARRWSPGQAFPARTWSSCSSTPQVGRDGFRAARALRVFRAPPRLLKVVCTSCADRFSEPSSSLLKEVFPCFPQGGLGRQLD